MRRLRLVILGFGLVVIAFLLIMPEVDPPDAAGVEATSATMVVRSHVPAPELRTTSESIHYSGLSGGLEMIWNSVEFVHPDFHSSLTLLCMLRC